MAKDLLPNVQQEIIEPLRDILRQLSDEGYLECGLADQILKDTQRDGDQDDLFNVGLLIVVQGYTATAIQACKRRGNCKKIKLPGLFQQDDAAPKHVKNWKQLCSAVRKIQAQLNQPKPKGKAMTLEEKYQEINAAAVREGIIEDGQVLTSGKLRDVMNAAEKGGFKRLNKNSEAETQNEKIEQVVWIVGGIAAAIGIVLAILSL